MSAETQQTEARPNRLGVVAATLLAVVAAATLAQALTYAFYGIPLEFNGQWAPGVLTVVAAFWMGAAVKSWASWRRWIWLPIGIAVVLGVGTTIAQVSMEKAAAEQAAIEKHEQMCADARAQLGALREAHAALAVEANKLLGSTPFEVSDTPPSPPTGEPNWAIEALGGSEQAAWDWYVQGGGPKMAEDIEDLEAGIAAQCD